jgi:predicted aminopeptidase
VPGKHKTNNEALPIPKLDQTTPPLYHSSIFRNPLSKPLQRIISRVILIVLLSALSGCTGAGYYAQSLKGHVEIMAARQDVGKLIGDAATPEPVRAQMASARDIRQFATDRLDLPDNASYRSYVDIGRDYVTLAVFAAPEFSLMPRVWCFPVFGCVPYRGYFSKDSAIRTARALKAEGLDVHISGITAYSTLGWSSDPLLSTMFAEDKTHLAALVFHELAHQRVYVNDDTGFNEAFAVVVETTGVKTWLRAAGDAAGLRRYEAGLRRSDDFVALVAQTRDELGRIYAGDGSAAEKRDAKSAAIDRLRQRHRRMRDDRWGGYGGYDGWVAAPINNAKIAATSVYNDLVPAFLRLHDLCAGDYPRFYAAVKRLGQVTKADRVRALEAVEACE